MRDLLHAPLYIDGAFREAADGARFDVIDPADESLVGTAAEATADDVAAAVGAARRAFDETKWSMDPAFRAKCLHQLQEGLRKYADTIKDVQTDEAGAVAALRGVTDLAIEEMSYTIELISEFTWEQDFPKYEAMGVQSLRRVRYEPYGVVAAITPWNAPFVLNLWKSVPALATGNTVVLKTAPETPLVGSLLARVVHECTDIPAGVFNLVSSSDNAIGGDCLTGDPRIDMFHFTGSTEVGRRIYGRAAMGMRKVVLELGGKSGNLILDDADLDVALPFSIGMCMFNSGQGCTLPTRMIVHASRYDEVVERLGPIVASLPVGDPRDDRVIVGPLIRRGQLDRTEKLVERAVGEGARVITGGHRLDKGGKGFWYAPTVLADVQSSWEIARTEVFGPVLTVQKYSGDDDEALRVINDNPYGLSAYIQTRDIDRAWYIAHRIRSGTVNIGLSAYNSPDTPFGGYGMSGVGREHGTDGWREFLQSKTIAHPA
jgi:aldehyde dehydrogenase (NAD+)